MQREQLIQLSALRVVVGYLGEKGQAGWWPSSFFAPGSSAFLEPIFPRTRILAQCLGVTAAAAQVHDDRIGVGHVYHLFRLPEDIEQGLHRAMHHAETVDYITQHVTDQQAAMRFLQESERDNHDAVGPTRIGDAKGLRNPQTWLVIAATYAKGFDKGTEVYPYFADRK